MRAMDLSGEFEDEREIESRGMFLSISTQDAKPRSRLCPKKKINCAGIPWADIGQTGNESKSAHDHSVLPFFTHARLYTSLLKHTHTSHRFTPIIRTPSSFARLFLVVGHPKISSTMLIRQKEKRLV